MTVIRRRWSLFSPLKPPLLHQSNSVYWHDSHCFHPHFHCFHPHFLFCWAFPVTKHKHDWQFECELENSLCKEIAVQYLWVLMRSAVTPLPWGVTLSLWGILQWKFTFLHAEEVRKVRFTCVWSIFFWETNSDLMIFLRQHSSLKKSYLQVGLGYCLMLTALNCAVNLGCSIHCMRSPLSLSVAMGSTRMVLNWTNHFAYLSSVDCVLLTYKIK